MAKLQNEANYLLTCCNLDEKIDTSLRSSVPFQAGATCGCEGGYVPDKFLAGTGDFPGLRVVAWKPNADYKTPKEASKK